MLARPARREVLDRGGQQRTGDEPVRRIDTGSIAVRALRRDRRQEGRHRSFSRKTQAAVPGALTTHCQRSSKETVMTTDNIFSGLKVVDFASFIAGPSAAVILSDFGADVIKVEPPTGDTWRIGHKIPPQPQSKDPYPFHLQNRNKRGIALDLKSPSAQQVLERLVKWADVFIVNTPHPARKKLKLEYDDVAKWNPRLFSPDVTV